MKAALVGLAALLLAGGTPDQGGKLDRLVGGTPETGALAGLQVVFITEGAVAHSYAGGVATGLEQGARVPLTSDHAMRVASISKLAVALGAMKLVEAGQLDLDADVSGVLGFPLRNPAYPDDPITLRQLLSHTSSVRDGERYWLDAGETMADFFTPGSPRHEDGAHFETGPGRAPGTFFAYTNLNFGLVAAMIERASGERFDRYMRRAVLRPLGIEGSFAPCDLLAEGRPLATLYRTRDEDGGWHEDGPWRAQVDGDAVICALGQPSVTRGEAVPGDLLPAYTLGSNPTFFSPQGGLRASATEIAALLSAVSGHGPQGRFLAPATREAMLSPQWTLSPDRTNGFTTEAALDGEAAEGLMTAYGLSVHLIDPHAFGLGGPALLAGHLGDAYGLLGMALVDPETGDGLVALVTGTARDPARMARGATPLHRIEEEVLRLWLETR